MKVREAIKYLKTYDPDYELVITLPPGWYNESDNNEEVWEEEGWTLDSVDYFLVSLNGDKYVAVCPLSKTPEELDEF